MVERAIAPAATSVTAFVGAAGAGAPGESVRAGSHADFVRIFGDAPTPLRDAVSAFFVNGGEDALIVPAASGYAAALEALKAQTFNLLCVLPATYDAGVATGVLGDALRVCVEARAMLLVDAPADWSQDQATAIARAAAGIEPILAALTASDARNAAMYFPALVRDGGTVSSDRIPAAAAVAGVFARVDRTRGVWKAAAGTEATVLGNAVPAVTLRERDNTLLNALGINCFRAFSSYGTVVWGARTLHGADRFADQFKYVPIRRLALFIENSLSAGLAWTAGAPNTETTWSAVRSATLAFLRALWMQGGLVGTKLDQAAFGKCDRTTMTQDDIDNGRLIVSVGFAALKPAEFIILDLRLLARAS